jgi:hypothetical protein
LVNLVEFKQAAVVCAESQRGIYLQRQIPEADRFWNGRGIEAYEPFALLMQELFTNRLRLGLVPPTIEFLGDESWDQVSMVTIQASLAKLNYRVRFLDKYKILSARLNQDQGLLGVIEFDEASVRFWCKGELHHLLTGTDIALSNIVSELSLKSGLELNTELVKQLLASQTTEGPVYLNARNSAGELVVWQPEAGLVNKIVENAYTGVAKQLATELKPLLADQEGVGGKLPYILVIGTCNIYEALIKRLQAELGLQLLVPAYPEAFNMLAVLQYRQSQGLKGYTLAKLDIF